MKQPNETRVVFMGTSDFAVPVLEALHQHHYAIGLVISQPDKPRGRHQTVCPTPVTTVALNLGLPILQPVSIRQPETVETLKTIAPHLVITASYGQILRKTHLSIPEFGTLNVHASLLPELRGASPIQSAIILGKTQTGCSIMLTEKGVDSGPVLASEAIPIGENDTAGTLQQKLARLGADLLIRTLPSYLAGHLQPIPQNHSAATFTKQLNSQDGWIDWSQPASAIACQIRGMNPCPGAFTTCRDQRLKIHFAIPCPQESSAESPHGTILDVVNGKGCRVQTGDGILLCLEIQPACRKRMRGDELIRGRLAETGEILGQFPPSEVSTCQE